MQALAAPDFSVRGESLVQFYPVPVGDFPPVDWIFFYSAMGVRYFFKQFSPAKTEGIRLAAMGQGTAEALEKTCRPADFTGKGEPEATAEGFLQVASGQRVLFPRAKDSKHSIRQILDSQIIAEDLVVYDNRPRSDFDLPDFDILVFTSPLNVKAYFSKKKLMYFQKVVAIGSTTAAALTAQGVTVVSVPDEPSEASLVKKILTL